MAINQITRHIHLMLLLFFIGTGCAVSGSKTQGPMGKEEGVQPFEEESLSGQDDTSLYGDGVEPQEEEIMEEPEKPSPRVLASLKLTDQGRELIENGRLDDAIRILEQAINLNSNNGQNYYYLAEAWLLKGVLRQASEFNQLAGQYLKGDQEWEVRVIEQRQRILDKTL
jgi:tetratricopeptide (TPR) repeat protein